MSASIARFLKDFGEPEAPVVPSVPVVQDLDFGAAAFDDFPLPALENFSVTETIDVESIREAAYEDGLEAGKAEAAALFDAERAALIESHQEALNAVGTRFEEELGEKLAVQMKESLEQIVALFSEQTLAVLSAILTEELSRKAASDLAALVKETISDGQSTKLSIKGTKPMFETFIGSMGVSEDQYQFTETSDMDLSVEIDESVVVTRMSVWASSLRKVMQ